MKKIEGTTISNDYYLPAVPSAANSSKGTLKHQQTEILTGKYQRLNTQKTNCSNKGIIETKKMRETDEGSRDTINRQRCLGFTLNRRSSWSPSMKTRRDYRGRL